MRSSSSDKGGELLQELEALSQALYKAQVNPLPRREFDQVRHRRRMSEVVGSRPKSQNTFLESRHSISELIPSKRKSQPEPEHKWVEQIEEEDVAEKLEADQKRKGFWNWKPLRALAHIGQQRFRCEFSAHVHGIDKLPAYLNGLRLQVKLRHHETSVQTMPARVSHGCAEFEEILHFRCTVYGSKKSSEFKYISKTFEMSVVPVDAEELDFGKHQLDLSRILPSRENDHQNVTWNTSFKMSGKAKGGSLWITFGYEMLNGHKDNQQQKHQQSSPQMRKALWSFNSLPNSPYSWKKKGTAVDFGSPSLSERVNNEHFNLDEPEQAKTDSSDKLGLPPASRRLAVVLEHRGKPLFPDIDMAPGTPGRADVVEDHETKLAGEGGPTVKEQEFLEDKVVEHAQKEQDEDVVEEMNDVEEEVNEDKGEDDNNDFNVVEEGIETGPLDVYADTTSTSAEPLEEEGIVDSSGEQEEGEHNEEKEALREEVDRYDWGRDTEEQVDEEDNVLEQPDKEIFSKSEDEAEIVAGEFLDMLEERENITKCDDGNELDSPRALLLKQFEQEAMLEEAFGIDLDEDLKPEEELDGGVPDTDDDSELAAIMDAAEMELQKATQAMKSKARAKMLEDAETEALLHEWKIHEKVFHNEEKQNSLEEVSSAVSNSVVRQQLPPLAPGFGDYVPTSDGGTLRSMAPAHFQGGKNDGKLVMHVSKPVVVPAEMGTSAMDVLHNLAGAGTQSMAAQALEAMPLEDITGKSVQQIALEGQACFEENSKRYNAATNRYALEDGNSTSSGPVAIPASTASSSLYQGKRRERKRGEQGDFLSLDELAPMAMEKIEELAMQGLKIQCDMADEEAPYTLEPPHSIPLLKGSSSNLLEGVKSEDGLISMSLTLDEWMRLDAGLVEEDEMSENTRAVMDTHRQAHTTTDLVMNLSGQSTYTKDSGKMGNTLTLAMLVQLRDPLRNYEPVGAPMMALVEAERVLVPPRPKLFKRIGLKGNSEEEYNDDEVGPKFKITGVHVAGLSVGEDVGDPKKNLKQWGSRRQQQSGSRWLIANGMGKTASSASKHPLLRSNTSKGKQGDSSLWSISSGKGGFSRNPDVKFGKIGVR